MKILIIHIFGVINVLKFLDSLIKDNGIAFKSHSFSDRGVVHEHQVINYASSPFMLKPLKPTSVHAIYQS